MNFYKKKYLHLQYTNTNTQYFTKQPEYLKPFFGSKPYEYYYTKIIFNH